MKFWSGLLAPDEWGGLNPDRPWLLNRINLESTRPKLQGKRPGCAREGIILVNTMIGSAVVQEPANNLLTNLMSKGLLLTATDSAVQVNARIVDYPFSPGLTNFWSR